MPKQFLTLSDLALADKTVLLRVDINSTIDLESGRIIGETRLRSHVPTIEALVDAGARVVLLAHQSRPGLPDCTKLAQHARVLDSILETTVAYVDDLIGSHAAEAVRALKAGEVLLLENTRLYAEEIAVDSSPERQAATHIVRNLAPLADYFVNDAFAAAHRAQPSLIGFIPLLPSAAGLQLEKELVAVEEAMKGGARPVVVHLGGVKADDSIRVAANMIERGIADLVLTSGLVAHIFLVSEGRYIGERNYQLLEEKIADLNHSIATAKILLNEHREKIVMPVDLAVKRDGARVEIALEALPREEPILDIGAKTIEEYCDALRNAKTIIANGPAGVFEDERFAKGTNAVFNAIADAEAYSVLGGGETGTVVTDLGIKKHISHLSMGGGALLSYLGGSALPVYEELKRSKRKYEAGAYQQAD